MVYVWFSRIMSGVTQSMYWFHSQPVVLCFTVFMVLRKIPLLAGSLFTALPLLKIVSFHFIGVMSLAASVLSETAASKGRIEVIPYSL